MKLYLGVDLHKKSCWITVMNGEGRVLESQRLGTERSFYERQRERHGTGKAIVALARKLAVISYYRWRGVKKPSHV